MRLTISVRPGKPNSATANTTATAPVAKASGSPVSSVTAKMATNRMLRNSMLIAPCPPGAQPMSRIRLATPCSRSSRPAAGMAALTGQTTGFHGVLVVSPIWNEFQASAPPTQIRVSM